MCLFVAEMDFTELIYLASERLGGAVLSASDDFFAPKENLLRLAKVYNPEDIVMKRWDEWLAGEAEIMKTLEVRGDRMH